MFKFLKKRKCSECGSTNINKNTEKNGNYDSHVFVTTFECMNCHTITSKTEVYGMYDKIPKRYKYLI